MRAVWTLLALALVPAVMAGEPAPQLKLLATLEGASPHQRSPLAFSPDGKLLACCDYVVKENEPVRGSLQLWDVNKRRVSATLLDAGASEGYGVGWVVFSPDGKALAASPLSGDKVVLFDVATGKEKQSFKGGGFVAYSPDGKALAVMSGDGTTLWDVSTGKKKASLTGGGFCMAFSPDGKLIATGSGKFGSEGLPGAGEVVLWDAATGRERAVLGRSVTLKLKRGALSELRANGVPLRVLAKLPALSGKEFPSEEEFEKELPKLIEKVLDKGQREKYGALVEAQVEVVREGPEVVWSVAFSPDGKTLASASVLGSVFLWDVKSGKRTAVLQRFNPKGREQDINPAYSVAFSPDGTMVAVGTVRGIKLWDVKNGEKPLAVSRPAAPVWSVAFSPDGRILASAGTRAAPSRPRGAGEDEPTLRLWEWGPGKKADR